MRRGTTPTLTFSLPFDASFVARGKVVLKQGETMLEKTLDECTCTGNVVSVTLTQEETFLFEQGTFVKVQLRVVTIEGTALTSEIYPCIINECLDDEVL